jgi:hypothetical protein
LLPWGKNLSCSLFYFFIWSPDCNFNCSLKWPMIYYTLTELVIIKCLKRVLIICWRHLGKNYVEFITRSFWKEECIEERGNEEYNTQSSPLNTWRLFWISVITVSPEIFVKVSPSPEFHF